MKKYVKKFYERSSPKKVFALDEVQTMWNAMERGFVQFRCTDCGKLTTVKVNAAMSGLQCSNCKNKRSLIKHYGSLKAATKFKTEASKQSLIKHYGSLENFEKYKRQKIEETNMKKYGHKVAGGFGTEEWKKAYIKKTGTDNSMKLVSTQAKMKKTKLDRYGDPNFVNPEKAKQTCMQRYGVSSYSKTDAYRKLISKVNHRNAQERMKKSQQTCLEKYGCLFSFQSKNNKEKSKQTWLKKYGVDNPSKSNEIMAKMLRKYDYDELQFDSSLELAYYFYLKYNKIQFTFHPDVSFKYVQDNKDHCYFPDFEVNGTYVELKGDHLLKNSVLWNPYKKKLLLEKTKCLQQNNVKILKYSELTWLYEWCSEHNFNVFDFRRS